MSFDIFSNESMKEAETSHNEAIAKIQVKAPWVSRYRPTKVNDIILPDKIKNMINYGLAHNEFTHMILHSGKPGTGKTTTSRAIPEQLGVDYLFFPIAKRSMDIIDSIQSFSMQKLTSNAPRFVILDEADRPSDPGRFYSALQPMIEATETTLRFILNCNNIHIIPEAIRSRCAPISFAYNLNDDNLRAQLNDRITAILEAEVIAKGGTVNQDTVKIIIDHYSPDIRATLQALYINFLENQGNIDGKPTLITFDVIEAIANYMRKADFINMRKFVSANVVDFQGIYAPIGDYLMERFKEQHRMPFAKLLATYQFRSAMPSVDQEINLNGLLAETTMLVHGYGK